MDITDSEIADWYNKQLEKTQLSDNEYKDVFRTNLLANRMQEYLANRVPTQAPEVHLHAILLATSDDAGRAKSRIESGETFATVASEVSLDTQSKSVGGDLGWIPRGVLPYDDMIFNLNIGQVSDPVTMTPDGTDTSQYAPFMVSEEESNRKIDDNLIQLLKARAFYNWLTQESKQHGIKYFYSEEVPKWVESQLAKASD